MAEELSGLKINVSPNPTPEIGIDTENNLMNNIIGAAEFGSLDISSIDALNQSAQNREQTYQLLDSMAQDSRISSVLECYAGDVVQPNDKGQIVWAEADNAKISEYTNWLLDTLNVDKHIYKWAYCLVTYGDVYLRLFRKSDVEEDLLFKKTNNRKLNESVLNKDNEEDKILNEDVKIRLYSASDKYIPYVKMVDNPGEMFDLQKFGKTHGYIKSPIRVMQTSTDELYNYLTKYKTKQSDVEVFDALSFVHGCLENTNQRQPETVDIFLDSYIKEYKLQNGLEDEDYVDEDSMTCSYDVKRGQSVLYNSFRTWRELNLLEMSALLNRLTKSAVVRILNIDIADLPKNQVEEYLRRLKEKIEQKAALNTNSGSGNFQEFNMSGPIENTIYVPTHEGKGAITATTLGGDFDPKSLVDLEYFKNMLYGSLRVPKQFFSETDDSTGFNAGSSLTIISARYGKEIKNIQNILCQMITDLVNLFLIDRGLDNYVNKFNIRMQAPITQEELDRRANNDTRLRYITDIMAQLDGVEDNVTKLRIYKSMISEVINDPDVVNILQEYIDKIQEQAEKTPKQENNNDNAGLNLEETPAEEETLPSMEEVQAQESFNSEEKEVINEEIVEEETIEEDEHIPSPEELGMSFLDED